MRGHRASALTQPVGQRPSPFGSRRAGRPPLDKEIKATTVVTMPIDEASAKIRTGTPVPDPRLDPAIAVPENVKGFDPG